MIAFLRRTPSCRIILVEKTDRLYRNLKDWVTIDELGVEVHFVKENVVLSTDARSSEKYVHGIKLRMTKNYIDNLSERNAQRHAGKSRAGDLALLCSAGLHKRRWDQWETDDSAGPTTGASDPPHLRVVRGRRVLAGRGNHES
jgi:hypothetical protein